MMDEIALEERASHHHASNSVVGLCHSHSHLVDPTLHTYDSALCIAEKLAEGLIHLGKEMSVLAVGSFGDDEIFPILTAPTCKCEDAEKMVSIFTLAIDRWRETGAEEQLGPIFSVATDGDSTRRAAGHRMFLKHELSMMYRLYGTLSHMPGLNLTTGDCEITLDFDYKHIFKCMKLNNGHSVTSAVLARYLTWLPDMDESAVTRLLNPDDPQDVPHAVELMQAIIALSKFKIDTITGDVGMCIDMSSIKSLGAILESLLLPFIDITLSLQQQVTYLSRYAHLTFTFFCLYRSTFMPHVLYYDSQTMAKNACFCIAKQQRLDGSQKFWLIQMGDDRLEKLFGITWMRGQHNSAMNYSQALDRISAAKDINTVFKKHPDLESGSRRLKITCTEGLDHICRDLWVGDVVASHCDLPSAWKDGRERALNVLADAHMPARGCDLMRPWGANKYLGVMLDVEDVESSTNSAIPLATATANDESELDEDILSLEEALTHDLASGNPNINTTIPSVSDSNTPTLVIGPGINPDGFLLVDGKYIHKETICLARPQQILYHERHKLPGRSITGGSTFIIGDIFLTIVCSNATLTIALVRSTLIEHHGITRHDILVANIGTPEVKLTGQILTLIPTFQPAEQCSWLWTGEYVKMKSDIQGINQSTDKIVEITVPGILVELANPETTCVRMHSNINSDNFFALNNLGNTWIIEEAALSFACNTLWRKACENNIILKSIIHLATPSDPSTFLYSLADGSTGVVCAEASKQLAATNAASLGVQENLRENVGTRQPCGCCGRSGREECKVQVKIGSSGAVSVATRCPYHTSFRWASANAGSKNRPCRNVPIKCELCHPTLAPVTGKKSRTGAPYVDPIWCYNMIDHLNETHPQYAHPKKTHGHPLPPDILNSFTLTSLEQREAGIPEVFWLVPLFDSDKENHAGPSSRKRKSNN
ncbi:hypothetical protein EV702DRAFT_1220308 [Suillus placidus]|uniref:Uncharacterized protein n=1 Tax=Suillus placidus TaxID=48579 RepID=A0A9P6ZFT3_9AGAM|nr:hypothetical protein EV702DRAFT_1220308 [Suillus placidus]